ncbi:hypothetical protein [Streptomyces sp. NBC_01353]|uniref:hypothetical protein n=1 Tax=Streptomyces sp. NBC_01353 TaxID=2903835 RepID=UPI002E3128FD|nr:hypothetical protein [Streptomyces sp. NBC_01353]
MTNDSRGTKLAESDDFPALARPDAGLILIAEWSTQDAERQRLVMDAVVDAWARAELPEAFLSRHCLMGSDGRTILNYAQWTDSAAHYAFTADPANQRAIAASVQALTTVGPPGRYTRDRVVRLREAPIRTLSATRSDDGVAQYFHRGEDGRRLHVLTAHDDDRGGTALRFRPYRGVVREIRETVRPRG